MRNGLLTYINRNSPNISRTFRKKHNITGAGRMCNRGKYLGRESDRVSILVFGFLKLPFDFGKGMAVAGGESYYLKSEICVAGGPPRMG